jgi:hypothetical protein
MLRDKKLPFSIAVLEVLKKDLHRSIQPEQMNAKITDTENTNNTPSATQSEEPLTHCKMWCLSNQIATPSHNSCSYQSYPTVVTFYIGVRDMY